MSIKVIAGPKVELSYSADDWELYSVDDRDLVAAALNKGMEELIAAAPTRSDFRLGNLLSKFAASGAADSEGYRMVDYILDNVYGVEF